MSSWKTKSAKKIEAAGLAPNQRGWKLTRVLLFSFLFLSAALVHAKNSPKPNGSTLREKRLLEAKVLRAQKTIGKTKVPAIKTLNAVLSPPGALATSYLLSPETFSPEKSVHEVLRVLAFSFPHLLILNPQGLANCDTVGCHQFAKQCAKKMNYSESATVREIFAGKASAQCILDFFQQPLHEQAKMREDANLDRILSGFSLGVRNLSCGNGTANVEVYRKDPASETYDFYFKKMSDWKLEKIKKPGRETFNYQIDFASDGRPEKVMTNHIENGDLSAVRFDDSGRPNLLQHCDQNKKCSSHPMDEVKSKKLYFWTDNRFPTGQIPTESFRWARESFALIDFQNVRESVDSQEEPVWKSNRIHDCCKDSKCQSYFSQRASAYQKAKEAVRSSSGAQ